MLKRELTSGVPCWLRSICGMCLIPNLAAVSAVLLTVLYRPYAGGILWTAAWATARPRHLAVFLAAIVAVPLFLLSL